MHVETIIRVDGAPVEILRREDGGGVEVGGEETRYIFVRAITKSQSLQRV